MTRLTPAQLAAVAAGAGFTGEALVRAVAVALAESGGDTAAQHVNSDAYRSVDRGLWQINSHWHPEVTNPFDPAANAAAAYRISSRGSSWSQWSTWNNGAAVAQLGRARIAIAQAGRSSSSSSSSSSSATPTNLEIRPLPNLPGIPIPGTGGIPDPTQTPFSSSTNLLDVLKGASTAFIKAGAWMSDSHNWLRASLVVAGAGGTLLALDMLAKSGAAGSTAADVAAKIGKASSTGSSAAAGAAGKTGSTAAAGAAKVSEAAGTAAKAAKIAAV